MTAIALSLIACIGWGTADFIGGLKSRETSTRVTLGVSTLSGTLLLTAFLLFTASGPPRDVGILWALPAGIVGLAAMYLLYRSLSIGAMTVLAPISATGVILPVIWGLVTGDDLSAVKLAGIAVAIAGAALAAAEKQRADTGRKMTAGAGLAAGSAVLIGIYFILMDKAAASDPIWASMVLRGSSLVFLTLVFTTGKIAVRTVRPHLPLLAVMGFSDTTAALCFAVATSRGMLSEVAVISSLYPAVTVLLSAAIIRDRIQLLQTAGVVMAITGVVLISAF